MESDNSNTISLTVCYCNETPEARHISPHVHCPCDKCDGRATYRMTAWRHLKLDASACALPTHSKTQDDAIQPLTEVQVNKPQTPEKEELDCWPSESCVQYEDLDIDAELSEQVYRSEGSYRQLPEPCTDVYAAANVMPEQGNVENENDTEVPENDDEADAVKHFVEDCVLRLVEMKQKMGCSVNNFEELLEWGRNIHTRENNDAVQHWPKNWDDVQTMLREMGFPEPKQYWICLRKDHPCHYGLMESKSEPCPYCGVPGTIPYYYLGLPSKVKLWCASPSMCKKMTAHWAERDHWLPAEMKEGWGWPVKHELWDGTRFANLSYFWDPNAKWTLPVQCTLAGCHTVISASELLNSPEMDGGFRKVKCPGCGVTFKHCPKEACGDPRNIAYCGHWDGWQPFSSTLRGCGAIEVSIATMSKKDRCHTDEVYVVGFVPSYLIPSKISLALDPFLEPLISDLEEGFINGIPVNYATAVAGISPGPAQIRHLLLCWKGDHPAQCEAGKFIKCGKKGCRRCNAEGVWLPASNHYYYPGFRKQGRFPEREKSVLDNLKEVRDIEEEERLTVKQDMSKRSGYTGLSIFHRLFPLYGFQYDKDFVYDEMHGIPLNVVKRQIQSLKGDDNVDLDWQEVDRRLEDFPWTYEYKTGRLPNGIATRFGFWKAEDLNHFAFPAMEPCLLGMLDDSHQVQEIVYCLSRIVEFLSNHARNGWRQADVVMFHEMCVRHAVLVEELRGLGGCVITLHNLLHFKEDIQRFSSLDNYSCWTEERAVRRYIMISNNHKNIELTFAFSEARREFLKLRREKGEHYQALTIQQADISKAWAKSLKFAMLLVEEAKGTGSYEELLLGIIVGGMNAYELSDDVRCTISLKTGSHLNDIPTVGWQSRSLWKPQHAFQGLLYRVGEHVIYADQDEGDTVNTLESLFSVRSNGKPFVFCKGRSFQYNGTVSGFRQVRCTENTVIFEASLLSRKVILFRNPELVGNEDGGQQQSLLVIDYMRRVFPVTQGTVVVPYYPQAHDMVDIKGGHGAVWKAHVLSYSFSRKTINAKFFVENAMEFPGKWIPERSPTQIINFASILGVSRGFWEEEYTSWINEDS